VSNKNNAALLFAGTNGSSRWKQRVSLSEEGVIMSSEGPSSRFFPPSGVIRRGRVRIEKKHGGRWLVVSEDYVRAWWEPDCLDWAAYTALHFASIMNLGEPELGPGVPPDALLRGRVLAEQLAAQPHPATGT
jgi:hypothetical protein